MLMSILATQRLASHRSSIRLGAVLAALGLAVGALLGFAGPLLGVAIVVAVAAAVWALVELERGLWVVIGVIALLPFAAVPVKILVTPTFLDLALALVWLTVAMQWVAGWRRGLTLTPAHAPLLAFAALAVVTFVAGLSHGALTPALARHFAELLLSIAMVVIVVDHCATVKSLERLVRVIALGGAAAAAVGIGLYVLPEDLANSLLSRLGVLQYPTGAVLRYIEDNPENAQRAIATSVDPNVLGGYLALAGGLLAPQLVARESTRGERGLAWAAFGLVLTCLILTFSRGAMLALGAGVLAIASLRYRRLLWLFPIVVVGLIWLPGLQDYALRFVQGAQGQDLATQMRFGEYKDALQLIARYPWGVGFVAAPDIDLYLGASNAYLVIAEQMGLIGLALFLAIVALIFAWGMRHWQRVKQNARLLPLWLGAHAGLLAALVVGMFDHYFFNLDFQPASTLFWIVAGTCLAATRLATVD